MADYYDKYSPLVDITNATTSVGNFLTSGIQSDKFLQKYMDTTLSFETKARMAEQNRVKVARDLEGWREGYLVFPSVINGNKATYDGDSGVIQDKETNQLFEYRGNSWNSHDTADLYEDVYKSKNKPKWQPEIVAKLNNKRVSDLTPEDFRNVETYNALETFKFLYDPNAKFEPYNKNKYYEYPQDMESRRIPILYKAGKRDFYNRVLTDIANPVNGKSVFDTFTTNPYINMSTRLQDSLQIEENLSKQRQYYESLKTPEPVNPISNIENKTKEYFSNTSKPELLVDSLGYLVDQFQASAYNFWGHIMKEYAPEFMVDKKYWEKMGKTNSKGLTGYESSVGMDPKWKHKMTELEKRRDTLFDQIWESTRFGDNDKKALLEWSQLTALTLPKVISESMGIMIPAAIAGTAGGIAAGALGAGSFATAVASVLTAGIAVNMENMAQTAEQFKENNGREMTRSEFWKAFAASLPASALDGALATTNLGILFKGTRMGKFLGKTGYKPLIEESSVLKTMGKEAGVEFVQEGWENTNQEYFGQKVEDNKSYIDVGTSPKVIESAIIGSLAGAAMGGMYGGAGKVISHTTNKSLQKAIENEKEYNDNHTLFGTEATEEVKKESNKILNDLATKQALFNTAIEKVSTEEEKSKFKNAFTKKLIELRNRAESNGNRTAYNEVSEALVSHITDIGKNVKASIDNIRNNNSITEEEKNKQIENKKNSWESFLSKVGLSDEELLNDIKYYSNPNYRATKNQRVSEENQVEINEIIRDIGSLSSLNEHEIDGIIKSSRSLYIGGPEGILAATRNIRNTTDELKTLIDKPKDDIEAQNRIDELVAQRSGSIERLVRLSAHIGQRMHSMSSAVRWLAQNPGANETPKNLFPWASEEGEGAFASRSDIRNNTGTGLGFEGKINAHVRELEVIKKALSEDDVTQEELSLAIANHNEKYKAQPNLQVNEDIFSDIDNTIKIVKDQTSHYKNLIINEYSESLKDKADKIAQKPNKAIKLIENLSKDKNDIRINEQDTTILKNIYENNATSWDNIKHTIKNNNNYSEEKKNNMLNVIQEVEDLSSRHKNNSVIGEEYRKASEERFNKGLEGYSEDKINKLINKAPQDINDEAYVKEYLSSANNAIQGMTNVINDYKVSMIDRNNSRKEDVDKLEQSRNNLLNTYNIVHEKYTSNLEKHYKERIINRAKDYLKNINNFDGEVSFSNNPYEDKLTTIKLGKDNNKSQLSINSDIEVWKKAFERQDWKQDKTFLDGVIIKGLKDLNFNTVEDYVDFEIEKANQMNKFRFNTSDLSLGEYYNEINKRTLEELGYDEIINADKNIKNITNTINEYFNEQKYNNYSIVVAENTPRSYEYRKNGNQTTIVFSKEYLNQLQKNYENKKWKDDIKLPDGSIKIGLKNVEFKSFDDYVKFISDIYVTMNKTSQQEDETSSEYNDRISKIALKHIGYNINEQETSKDINTRKEEQKTLVNTDKTNTKPESYKINNNDFDFYNSDTSEKYKNDNDIGYLFDKDWNTNNRPEHGWEENSPEYDKYLSTRLFDLDDRLAIAKGFINGKRSIEEEPEEYEHIIKTLQKFYDNADSKLQDDFKIKDNPNKEKLIQVYRSVTKEYLDRLQSLNDNNIKNEESEIENESNEILTQEITPENTKSNDNTKSNQRKYKIQPNKTEVILDDKTKKQIDSYIKEYANQYDNIVIKYNSTIDKNVASMEKINGEKIITILSNPIFYDNIKYLYESDTFAENYKNPYAYAKNLREATFLFLELHLQQLLNEQEENEEKEDYIKRILEYSVEELEFNTRETFNQFNNVNKKQQNKPTNNQKLINQSQTTSSKLNISSNKLPLLNNVINDELKKNSKSSFKELLQKFFKLRNTNYKITNNNDNFVSNDGFNIIISTSDKAFEKVKNEFNDKAWTKDSLKDVNGNYVKGKNIKFSNINDYIQYLIEKEIKKIQVPKKDNENAIKYEDNISNMVIAQGINSGFVELIKPKSNPKTEVDENENNYLVSDISKDELLGFKWNDNYKKYFSEVLENIKDQMSLGERIAYNNVVDIFNSYSLSSIDSIVSENTIKELRLNSQRNLNLLSKYIALDALTENLRVFTRALDNRLLEITNTPTDPNSNEIKTIEDTFNPILNPAVNISSIPWKGGHLGAFIPSKSKENKLYVYDPFTDKEGKLNTKLRELTEEDIRKSPTMWQKKIFNIYSELKINKSLADTTLNDNIKEYLGLMVNSENVGFSNDNLGFYNFHKYATVEDNLKEALKYYKEYWLDYLLKRDVLLKAKKQDTASKSYRQKDAIKNNTSSMMIDKFRSNPFLRMLFNWPISENGKALFDGKEGQEALEKLEFNMNMIGVVDFTLRQFLHMDDLSQYFKNLNSLSKEQVARLWGIQPDALEMGKFYDIKDIMNTYGIPSNFIKNLIGDMIAKNIGLTRNESTGTDGFYERFIAGAGDFAIKLGQQYGFFEVNHYKKETYEKQKVYETEGLEEYNSPIEYDQDLIRVPKNKVRQIQKYRSFYKAVLKTRFVKKENGYKKLRLKPKDYNEKRFEEECKKPIPRTQGMYIPPYQQVRAKLNWENTAHQFHPIVQILNDIVQTNNENKVESLLSHFIKSSLKIMSPNDVFESGFDTESSMEGKLNTAEYLIEGINTALQDLENAGKSEFYFDYRILRNMRFMLDNSLINPQSNKILRWLVPQSAWNVEWNPTHNVNHKDKIVFAMAQAFDLLKTSEDEQLAAYEMLTSLSADEVHQLIIDFAKEGKTALEKYTYTFNNEEKKLGIESPAQVIVALYHFKLQAEAQGNPFKSYLAVENDSVTSGYMLRQLNIPITGMDEWNKKMGCILDVSIAELEGKSVHDIKRMLKYNDVYESSAELLQKYLDKDYGTVFRMDSPFNKEYSKLSVERKKKVIDDKLAKLNDLLKVKFHTKNGKLTSNNLKNYAQHAVLLSHMEPVLPKAKLTESGAYLVTKTLRNLLKPGVMVFGYDAGLHSISRNLADLMFYDTYYHHYMQYMAIKTRNNDYTYEDYFKEYGNDFENSYQIKSLIRFFEDLWILRYKNNNAEITAKYKDEKGVEHVAKSMYELLLHKSYSNILVNVDGKTMNIFDVFANLIEVTYGKACWDGLQSVFKPYIKINDSLNEMAAVQYTQFKDMYDQEIDKALEEYSTQITKFTRDGVEYESKKYLNIGIPIIIKKKIINDLEELYPGAPMYFEGMNTGHANLVRLLNTKRTSNIRDYSKELSKAIDESEKKRINNLRRRDPYTTIGMDFPVNPIDALKRVDGNEINLIRNNSIAADIFDFAAPGMLGAVLPIHGLDSTNMALTNLYVYEKLHTTFLGVFDAFISSAMFAGSIPCVANTYLLSINKNYSIFESVFNRTVNSILYRYLKYDNKVMNELNNKWSKYFDENSPELAGINSLNELDLDTFIRIHTPEVKFNFAITLLSKLKNNGILPSYLLSTKNGDEYLVNYYTKFDFPPGFKKDGKLYNKTDLLNTLASCYNLYYKGLDYTEFVDGKSNKLHINPLESMRTEFYNRNFYICNVGGYKGSGVSHYANSFSEKFSIKEEIKEVSNYLDTLFKNNTNAFYSSPKGFVSNGIISELTENINSDPKKAVELYDYLEQQGRDKGLVSNSEEVQDIHKKLLLDIDMSGLEELRVVTYNSNAVSGMYSSKDKEISIGIDDKTSDLDPMLRRSIFSDCSPSTAYIHELIHAAFNFGINHREVPFINSALNQLRKIYDQVFDSLDNEDVNKRVFDENTFLQEHYDPSLEQEYKEYSANYLRYMFANDDSYNDRGFLEFIAISLTHPKAITALKKQPSLATRNTSLFSDIVSIIKSFIKALFTKNGEFREVVTGTNNLINSIKMRGNKNLYDDIVQLSMRIMNANQNNVKLLDSHLLGRLEKVFNFLDSVKNTINKKGQNFLNNIYNYAVPANPSKGIDEISRRVKVYNWLLRNLEPSKSRFILPKLGKFGLAFASALFSDVGRQALKGYFLSLNSIFSLSFGAYLQSQFDRHQGFIASSIRDFTRSDFSSAIFEQYAMHTRSLEASSKALQSTVQTSLDAHFTKEDKKEEKQFALTNSVLFPDTQCLVNDNLDNVEEIQDLLDDDKEIQTRIDELQSDLKTIINNLLIDETAKNQKVKKAQVYNFVANQAICLGKYMAKGIGNEFLNTNANNIALLNYLPVSYFKYRLNNNKKAVDNINKLATYYALLLTDNTQRTFAKSISKDGFKNFIREHKSFIKDTYEGTNIIDCTLTEKKRKLFEDIPVGYQGTRIDPTQKGYIKHIFDPNVEMTFAPNNNKTEDYMRKNGWIKQKQTFLKNKMQEAIALYIRPNYFTKRYDGTSFIMARNQHYGYSLNELVEDVYNVQKNTQSSVLADYKPVKANFDIIGNKIKKIMLNSPPSLNVLDAIDNFSYGALPIARKVNLERSDSGNVLFYKSDNLGYRFTGNREHNDKVLHMEMNATEILSRMYATMNTKVGGHFVNNNIVKYLYNYMKTYMDPTTHKHIEQKKNIKFVKLASDSKNTFLRENWKVIPESITNLADRLNLYIREDWLEDFIGIPNMSLGNVIVDSKLGKTLHLGYKTKKVFQMAEAFMKLVSAQTKKLTIIGTPKVLLGNVISNILHTLYYYPHPTEVFKMMIANAKYSISYMDDKKKLDALMYKVRQGTATSTDELRINHYKAKLMNNPTFPLMRAGMFQNIVEDIREEDLDKTGTPYKMLKKLDILDKIDKMPTIFKGTLGAIWRNGTLANNSGLFKLLYTMTKYSDFISRVTEYQIQMRESYKIPVLDKKNNVTKYIEIPKKYNDDGTLNTQWSLYEKQVRSNVIDTFINYDKPHSSIEQYLNDMGLVMYTKFAKRIQSVIAHLIKGNPFGLLVNMGINCGIGNLDDIVEQHLLTKDISALFHTPLENTINAAIPFAGHVFLGDIDLTPSPFKH